AGPAVAQPGPARPGKPPSTSVRDTQLAKEHFQRGVALMNDEKWEAAYAEFKESLKLHVTFYGTLNAAYCLKNLGRFDEALKMYEIALHDFADRLTEDQKRLAAQRIDEFKNSTGVIEIEGAVPGATVVLDEVLRGEIPLGAPLRVKVGTHL